MRVVIQKVQHATCTVDHVVTGSIQQGFVLFVGFCAEDNAQTIEKMIRKITHLRIFLDQEDKMNLSIEEVKGEILSISQFTLYANCKKGNRPSFVAAAPPTIAKPLYDQFNEGLVKAGFHTEMGIFGADMKIELVNDGPITICLDSEELFS